MKKFKYLIGLFLAVLCLIGLVACNEADNIRHNIAEKSDNFETYRRITVINLRSDAILLQVEGYIAIKDSTDSELAVIIRTGKNEYKMHYIYTGAEIVYLVEQLEPSSTDPYHWEIRIFAVKPDISWGEQ